MINQFGINIGFYMLMPYLAAHLTGSLGLAAATAGLILGARNLTQQGMFAISGLLADRIGYRPLIIAGCGLRVAAFTMLGFAHSIGLLLAATMLTGLAGALFNPAVRAYLAADSGARRVEAFATFNTFYQAGILAGPLAGLAAIALGFPAVCLAAAAVFAVLTAAQLVFLPPRRPSPDPATGIAGVWRLIWGNRGFVTFATVMSSTYLLTFQVYLALPLFLAAALGPGPTTTVATTAVFVLSGLITVARQTRTTAWCRNKWPAHTSLTAGAAILTAAFLTPAAALWLTPSQPAILVTAGLACAALITVATMIAYPFEMDTIVTLSGNRLVATHYGVYSTLSGISLTLGNTAIGWAYDHLPPIAIWLALAALGAATTAGLHRLPATRSQPTPHLIPASPVLHQPQPAQKDSAR
ncbi:MFS transporter [Catellatospora methionotrophica]|uniref:MFS transporter n=1 Tax=Catellatospora methionotrophica TaxID=121620 RepID=UPI00341192F1